jgi:hypothetical protein
MFVHFSHCASTSQRFLRVLAYNHIDSSRLPLPCKYNTLLHMYRVFSLSIATSYLLRWCANVLLWEDDMTKNRLGPSRFWMAYERYE